LTKLLAYKNIVPLFWPILCMNRLVNKTPFKGEDSLQESAGDPFGPTGLGHNYEIN